ncbi:MAG: hypothetical protein RDV48_19330 [Candidatus Eremiobacteraeota bacterium]|nr:hypothetical protein [Candidatus Eremiobacteraeota bacterium]
MKNFCILALAAVAVFCLGRPVFPQAPAALSRGDFAIGSVAAGDSFSKAVKVFGKPTLVKTTKDEISGSEVHHYRTASGVEFSAADSPDVPDGRAIWSITVSDAKFATPRGIKVGDAKSLVINKYGKPPSQSEVKTEGKTLIMLDYSSMKFYRALVFFVNKSRNAVEKIQAALIID